MSAPAEIMSLDKIIEQGSYNGKSFRVSADYKVSVLDWIAVLCDVSANTARMMLKRISDAERSEQFLSQHRFSGQGQRGTPVADAMTLLKIIQKLPPKYPGVAKFLEEQNKLTARYLGGDTSLEGEVQAIRELQETLPESHPLRVFGRAVESGEVGKMVRIEPGSAEAIKWHDQRAESKIHTKRKSQSLHDQLPWKCSRLDYAIANATISRPALGMNPKEFKLAHKIPAYKSARDFMTVAQLSAVTTMENAVHNIIPQCGSKEEFKERCDLLSQKMDEFAKIGGIQGYFIEAAPAKPVPEVEPAAEPAAIMAAPAAPEAPPPKAAPVQQQTTINNFFAPCNNTISSRA
jgi:hypothetical protein